MLPHISEIRPGKSNYYYDFVAPASAYRSHPVPDYIEPRSKTDYLKEYDNWSLPNPNLRRGLLTEKSLEALYSAFTEIQKKYPNRFDYFDVHLRGLYRKHPTELVLPWDTLTHVRFDGIDCYMPIDVSFSHTIMTARWSKDAVENLQLKRDLVEAQLYDITSRCGAVSHPGIFCVSVPILFAQGNTDKIFREYPQFVDDPEINEFMRCKRVDLDTEAGKFAFYFFPGWGLRHAPNTSWKGMKSYFEEKISEEACVEFCKRICADWNNNFHACQYNPEDDSIFSNISGPQILRQMGALID